jgi:fucose 4-O-acetylase-like acetyltransferase
MDSRRIGQIDTVKGLAIFSVIIGHLIATLSHNENIISQFRAS